MKKVFFLPLLFVVSFCFSQKIQMQIKGMPESGNGTEVLSFSWGASNPVSIISGGGTQTGRVSVSSFNLMKYQDKTSLKLIEAVTKGMVYAEVVITLLKDDKPTFRYTLTDVYVESFQISHSTCKDCTSPTESVSLAPSKWKWENLATQQSYEYDLRTVSSF